MHGDSPTTFPLPRGAPRGSPPGVRGPAFLLASMIALSCTDAPTAPAVTRGAPPVMLDATAAFAVQTVLGDVGVRVPDALEDAATRARFAEALDRLRANLAAGLLDDAEKGAADARAALTRAAELDNDGTGDADRSAIILALEVANQEITNARRTAAGGIE